MHDDRVHLIELTLDSAQPIYINPAHILAVIPRARGSLTAIVTMKGDCPPYYVQEDERTVVTLVQHPTLGKHRPTKEG